jgi:hypothetical protein
MTTATPIPPPYTSEAPPPVAAPLEPPQRSHTLLWLVLGGLALLFLAAGVATFVFLARADDKTAVVNDHTTEAGEPTLIEVAGYAYTDPQAEEAAVWDATMTQVNEKVAAVLPARFADIPWVTSWSLHAVNHATGGRDSLALGLIEINPQFANVPYWDDEFFLNSVAVGMVAKGTTATTETIDGETVAVARETGEDWATFTWFHEGTVGMTAGPDEDAVRAFAEAYITEQNS